MPVPEEIFRYCPGLVTIVVTEYEIRIQLSHFSVKEWLISDQLDKKLSGKFNSRVANAAIASVCVAYLLELDQVTSLGEMGDYQRFIEYSTYYWADHVVMAEAVDEPALTGLVLDLLLSPRSFQNSLRSFEDGISPFIFTLWRKMFHFSQLLIESGADVHQSG